MTSDCPEPLSVPKNQRHSSYPPTKSRRPLIVFTYKLFTHLAVTFFWRGSVAGVLYVRFGSTCDALIGQLAGDADAS